MARSDGMAATELALDFDVEAERVFLWRKEELERAGYERPLARKIAESVHVDLHLATSLLRAGCPVDTALRILL
jgi:hypothetical protein